MSDTTTAEAAAEIRADPQPEDADSRPEPAPWPLHVLSTPSRRGAALAAAAWQALSGAGRVASGGLAAASPPAPAPGARHLVFVDSPAAAVAGALLDAGAGPADVAGRVDAWTADARRLLRLVMQQPTRCLCIDVAEALQQPDALWAAIAEWEPALRLTPAPAVPPVDDDALALLLAQAATRSAGAATRLFDELQATSVVLAEDAATAPAEVATGALAAYAAVHTQLARRTEALQQALKDADAQRQDAQRLLSQLRQVQEQLEAQRQQRPSFEREIQAARAAGAKAQEEHAQAMAAERQRLQAAQAESDAARQALTAVEQERDAARKTLASAEQERDAQRQESDLLLAQLHQVQEELEAIFLKGQDQNGQLAELQKQHTALQAERDAQARLVQERTAALQLAEAARRKAADDSARLSTALADAAKAREAAEKARQLLAAQADTVSQRLTQVVAQRDAEARLAEEREAQAASLQRDLAQAHAERSRLAGAVTTLEAALVQAQTAAAAASSERGELAQVVLDLRSQQAEAHAALQAQRDEGNRLLEALAETQSALEQRQADFKEQLAAAVMALQDLEQQRDALVSDLDRQQARGAEWQLRAEQQAARIAELDAQGRRQREQLAQAGQQQAQTATQLVQVGQQLRRAQQEHALLAGQMLRMHGELQQQDRRQRREGRPAPVTVAQVEPGAERTEPPYRDLACLLREVRIDEHEIPLLELRLVEHHGHPGLVLFDGPTPGAGLGAFERSGDEDGRAYMLLVPEDLPARKTLARLGTHDWRLVCGVLTALDEALALPEAEPLLFWRGVLRRLQAQIDDQPVRLRYDSLDLAAETSQTLRLDYRRTLFGERLYPGLSLRWTPGARGSAGGQPPTLLLGELGDAGPPLSAWPMDAQGHPQGEWRLPLDPATPSAERQARWRQLPARDRELLLALLDALPAAAERLAEAQLLPPGHDRDSLKAAAAHWLPEARRALDPVFPLRRAARKLRSILRPAA